MTPKRIPIAALQVGMYVCGFDRSWLQTPFFTHRFLIQHQSQIDKLLRSGIREVEIDPSRGIDVRAEPGEAAPAEAEPATADSTEPEPERHEPSAPPDPPPQAPPVKSPSMLGRELTGARQARQELLQRVESVFESVSSASTIRSEAVRDVVQDIMGKTLDNQAAFLALVRTRDFDPALRDHLLCVSTLALIVGKALGYDAERLQHLAAGALLHDVGLLRLPHYMYRLPHALRKRERSLYESHPQLGTSLLQRNGGFHPEVIRIVAEHHEALAEEGRRGANAGRGDAGKDITEASRLVMVLDRYDEFLTGQHDPTPLPSHQALSRLYQEARSNRLDLQMVSHLIRVIGVYPLYSLVELNTGERGLVTAVIPGKLHVPVIALFLAPDGRPITPPVTVDLSREGAGPQARSIVTTLDADKEQVRPEDILAQLEPEEPRGMCRTQAG